MVGSYGMAGSLVSYEAIEAGPITQGIVGKVLGNEDARAAVEKLLAQAKADVQVLLGDNTKFVQATGWQPTIPFEQTLRDMLEHWRSR